MLKMTFVCCVKNKCLPDLVIATLTLATFNPITIAGKIVWVVWKIAIAIVGKVDPILWNFQVRKIRKNWSVTWNHRIGGVDFLRIPHFRWCGECVCASC